MNFLILLDSVVKIFNTNIIDLRRFFLFSILTNFDKRKSLDGLRERKILNVDEEKPPKNLSKIF